MKEYLVIGAGRFGRSLAENLMKLGHEVIIIDNNEENVNKISPYVTHAICANIKNIEVFHELGLANIQTAIIAIGSDLEASILATITLKEIGVKTIIGKASTDYYAKVLKKVGIDKVIIPEKESGRKLAYSLSSKNLVDYFNIIDDYSIFEVTVPPTWVGKTIIELDIRAKHGFNIVGIIRESGEFIGNPEPHSDILAGDMLVILGTSKDFMTVEKIINGS
ncbi:potassium channel family protein [Facklamia miroungae]|uniref:Trk system potassium uptake protein TrkA n=1 Tax=Facklamia miroungae TaxID=120956 RepID=A0A1G7PCJ7_9LACT|nr:TrkA family potassium uptake protein [Facklamia miroungae]NKZ28664.1 TrkA family potassium uptake protein [Facklamia miroungae]SDF84025.1 trk system potassium uptake protein TrkA [Facklamia miroungae]